ncbi:hypothetical protein ILUMI_14740, partial [Ignelater luminosus]
EGANQILLGGQACVYLKLVKRINNATKCENPLDKEQFINQNVDIFSGSGKFPGACHITISQNFEAVSHPPSKVPFAICPALKNELDRLIKREDIVKVNEIDSPELY